MHDPLKSNPFSLSLGNICLILHTTCMHSGRWLTMLCPRILLLLHVYIDFQLLHITFKEAKPHGSVPLYTMQIDPNNIT
jgi:hypothetical protein